MEPVTNNRIIFLLVFILALGVRLLNLAATDFSTEVILYEDARLYWVGATSGDGFTDTVKTLFFNQTERMLGYFIFLAALISLFGEHFLAVLLVQSIIDSFTCLMIMALGHRTLRDTYWVFGILAAFWPNLIIHSAYILTDTLFVFIFTGFLLTFVQLIEKKRFRNAIVTGVLLGLATTVRPVTQFIILLTPILIPLVLLCIHTKLKQAINHGLIIFLVSTACISPVLIKNSYQFGSFALTSQSGPHLQSWVAAEVVMLRDTVSRSQAIAQLSAKSKQSMSSMSIGSQNNPFTRSSKLSKTAIGEILTSPISIVLKSWIQGMLVNLASPAIMIDKRIRALPHLSFASDTKGSLIDRLQEFIAGSSAAYVAFLLAGGVGAIVVSLFQFSGFFLQFQKTPVLASLALLTLGYFLLVYGPVASPKYRLPLEPILIIWFGCASITGLGLINSWRHRRTMP